MKATRRSVIGGSMAAFGLGAAPGILHAQPRPPASRTVRAVLHSDIATYDPIWTAANIAAYHGGMVYDMLLGKDAQDQVRPQMVDAWEISEDKREYRFRLRDKLRFSDNTEVTTADIIPSLKRWIARSAAGQLAAAHFKDLSAVDGRIFRIALDQPFPLLLDILASPYTPLPYMMRKREAETDPMQKIDRILGSGPFVLNEAETKVGSHYVYDRSPTYVPRPEPASGTAGGKLVKVDRVVYVNMPDAQTAVAALQAGEIDFYEVPPIDLLDQLETDPNITIENLFDLGLVGLMRLNWMYPPFDNVKCRQALLYIMNQKDMLRPTFVSEKWFRGCDSWFTCGSPMENSANTDWYKRAPEIAKAKQLLKEGGYDGRPVVLMQATNVPYMSNAATVFAQQMRAAGINVDLQAMDWGAVVQRRASQSPPDKGGWNIFITSGNGLSYTTPYADVAMSTTGAKAWYGWPSDAKNEELRQKWMGAETLEQRKAIAVEIQENAWNVVPHLHYGQWIQPVAHRKNVRGWLHIHNVIGFWNVEKV